MTKCTENELCECKSCVEVKTISQALHGVCAGHGFGIASEAVSIFLAGFVDMSRSLIENEDQLDKHCSMVERLHFSIDEDDESLIAPVVTKPKLRLVR